MIAWISLVLAGLAEIAWAVSMKLSDGFSKPQATIVALVSAALSFSLLAYSLKSLPISVAYPIWVAIGVVGVSMLGMFWLKEPVSATKIVCIGMIVVGSVGLKWVKL